MYPKRVFKIQINMAHVTFILQSIEPTTRGKVARMILERLYIWNPQNNNIVLSEY